MNRVSLYGKNGRKVDNVTLTRGPHGQMDLGTKIWNLTKKDNLSQLFTINFTRGILKNKIDVQYLVCF